jgi:HSP20 family protein
MVGAFGLSPFGLMRRMMEDLDRLFQEFGGGRGFELGSFAGPVGRGLSVWSPAIEALEREGNFVLRADLPGLSPDDVRVEAANDSLVIEGERRSEIESEEQAGVYRSERTYGRFSRVVPLPEGADAQKAQARFENGVLEITIPMAEEKSSRRRIEIERASGERAQQRSGGEPSVH